MQKKPLVMGRGEMHIVSLGHQSVHTVCDTLHNHATVAIITGSAVAILLATWLWKINKHKIKRSRAWNNISTKLAPTRLEKVENKFAKELKTH